VFDDSLSDIRYALRQFRRNPGFSAVAIAMLALGIGLNGTVFTIANGILFRGTPHVDPGNRIAYIQTSHGVSYPDFDVWRTEARSFDGQMGVVFIGGNRSRLDDQRGPSEMYDATQLSANAFRVLNQRPILGRDFLPSDEVPGAPPVIIISYHLWERRYAKDPAIIGQTARINSTPASWGTVDLITSTPATIVGVMPAGFRFPLYRVDLWLPLVPTAGMLFPNLRERQNRSFMLAFGRLAGGVTLQQARAEMEDIGRRLEAEYPSTNRGVVPSVRNFRDFWLGPSAVAIYGSMWAAVAFVLLIACANLANLLLARAIGRSREISVRIALGAGRWRIARQLLIESLMLSTAGGVLGGALAGWGVRAYYAVATDPYSYARWDYSMDYGVLAYLVGVSLITGVLFGLAPAMRCSRLDVNSTLKEGGGGAVGGRGGRLSALLVTGEMALAVVLLAGASVMVDSVLTIATSDLGVKSGNVLTMLVGLPRGRYPDAPARISVVRQVLARLGGLPGVESVAVTTVLPAGAVFHSAKSAYELGGRTLPAEGSGRSITAAVSVSAGYFETLGASIRQGRPFAETDGASSAPVAIVNERFARLSWPGEDPIGKQLRFTQGSAPGPWLTIIGVVSNIVQDDRLGQQFDPVVYRPFQQQPEPIMWVLARTAVTPASLATTFRRNVEALDHDLLAGPGAAGIILPLEELLRNNYRSNSVNGVLFVMLAAIALVLASVGQYAVIAHSISQRTREIGIRTAMGARPGDIFALVIKQGMFRVGVGLLIGLPAALAVTPVLKSQLVGVSPSDPVSLLVASGVLVLCAALGCWNPARRAVSVDPVTALRHE
jgi:predicted permease